MLLLVDFPRTRQLPEDVKKQNAGLGEAYSIQGYPTVLLLDAEGKLMAQTGYRAGGAAKYVEHLRGLLKKKPANRAATVARWNSDSRRLGPVRRRTDRGPCCCETGG